MKKHLLTFFLFVLFFSTVALGQQTFQLDSEQTEISVDGTSTLHDWTMTLEPGHSTGQAAFLIEDGTLSGIEVLELSFESEALKSGKAPMDNNAYNALKSSEHPDIALVLNEVKSSESTADGFLLHLIADLTIAGTTKPVSMTATCSMASGGTLTCSGTQPIKMSEFNVEPPTIMLGSVKTGDDVTIKYRAVFVK